MSVQLDLQQVIPRLAQQIGSLTVDLEAAKVFIDALQARIVELETPPQAA